MTSRWSTAVFSLLVGIFCAALFGLPAVQSLEQAVGLPWLFQLRGSKPPPPSVAVVVMDQRAASNISLPRDPEKFHRCEGLVVGRAPSGYQRLSTMPARWPRCVHAQLVEKLASAGAQLIAFDVLFRERPPLPGLDEDLNERQDTMFANALASSGRAVIAQKVELQGGDEVLANVSPTIQAGALGSAPFPLVAETERRVDGFVAFKEAGLVTPTLPVIAMQAFEKNRYSTLVELLARYAGDDAQLLRTADSTFEPGGRLETSALLIRELFRHDRALAARVCGDIEQGEKGALADSDGNGAGLRALIAMYDGDESRLLNFYGPAGTIPAIGYDEILGASLESVSARAAGRAIFIGYAEALQHEQVEHFATAFSSRNAADLSGVELAATAFSNLLEDSSIRKLAEQYGLLIVFASGALAWLVGSLVANKGAVVVMGIAAVVYAATATYLFGLRALWVPLIAPITIAAPFGLLSAFSWKYWTAYRQREQLRRAFSYFVPAEIVSMLERNASQVSNAHELLECACVSTDATNFTPLAESMSPDSLTEFLDHYFEALFGGVAHQGGFVSDVVGDGMMAIWAHRTTDTHQRLLYALLEMRDSAQRFEEHLEGNRLVTRFGVDWGRVALTTVGALSHYEYRAVGDAVNTAQRIQELNKKLGTRVLVSSLAVGDAGERFLLRDLGMFLMRGKTHEVHLHELVASRADATPEQNDLCARFADAIETLRSGNESLAISTFQVILASFPTDGPTKFFLRCLESGISLRDGAFVTD